jgi:regulator of cell morphogenesis and NO signaling
MQPINPYTAEDKMLRLVADNYNLLHVMSRFGIKVGFGDKSINEVCEDYNVDTTTFLAVVNFILNHPPGNTNNISVKSLLLYLSQSHSYFLEFCLPAIRRKLLDGITVRTTDVSFLILKFFDEYMAEIRTHMEYEEKTVFEYVNHLIEGKPTKDYKISIYSHHHDEVSSKLKELKRLILKYCPDDANMNLLNEALYDIYRCENELESHCGVEDYLLVPAIKMLEKKVSNE